MKMEHDNQDFGELLLKMIDQNFDYYEQKLFIKSSLCIVSFLNLYCKSYSLCAYPNKFLL